MRQLTRMATFATIVETGSISAAARQLGLSPSAISQQLHQLENLVGLSLLHRSTRQLVLTEAGQQYYECCATIMRAAQDAELRMSELRETPSGQLRITTSIGFALRHLPAALAPMLKQHPRLSLQVISRDEQIDLYEHRIDLAIRLGKQRDSNLTTRTLARWERVLCAAPEYLKRHGMPLTPEDLGKHEFLTLAHLSSHEDMELHDGNGQSIQVAIHSRIRGDNSPAAREMMRQGLGINSSLLPDVIEDLASGRLVRLLPQWQLTPVSLHAVTPGSEQPPKVSHAIEAIRRYLQHIQQATEAWHAYDSGLDTRGFLRYLSR